MMDFMLLSRRWVITHTRRNIIAPSCNARCNPFSQHQGQQQQQQKQRQQRRQRQRRQTPSSCPRRMFRSWVYYVVSSVGGGLQCCSQHLRSIQTSPCWLLWVSDIGSSLGDFMMVDIIVSNHVVYHVCKLLRHWWVVTHRRRNSIKPS
jgi:hypothetical protein